MTDTGENASPLSPSQLIDERIAQLADWRGARLAALRAVITGVDPQITEEWKWVKKTSPGTAVWAHGGGICTGEIYKSVVKLTFFKGASLADPSGLFNAGLEGKVRRAIDYAEPDQVDEQALADLVREAIALNLS
ncbi:DUF1801 domain-containing protein [Kineosporia succinea]|uniref:YdhG-like domain-containing protein n=1 Tax=Kineosporia succinea TaxID=84632 RepID=A0ABT9PDK2_9ACTN|nr:DUF1801 domain-containing protein [Kineosporia succinea]MDP9830778.1 hypothetical protein [Kineosporia succinea]